VRIDSPDLESERERPRRDRAADPAEADHGQLQPSEGVQRSRDGVVPAAGANAAVERDDSADQSQ
jgi:hypothetical protein